MALEDLNFKIKADVADPMAALGKMNSALTVTDNLFAKVQTHFTALPRLAESSTANIAAINTTAEKAQRTFGELVKSAVYFEDTMSRRASVDAVNRLTGGMTQLRIQSDATANNFDRMANNSNRVIVAKATKPTGTAGGVINVASTVAQVAVMSKLSTAMTSVKTTTLATADAFRNFRAANTAPKVDPKLNLLKTGVESAGNSVAKFIEKFRGVADASISGFPKTLVAIGTALSLIVASFDRAGATLSEFLSTVQTSSAGLKLLQTVFFPLAKTFGVAEAPLKALSAALGKASNEFTKFTGQAAGVKNAAAGIGYVMTGTFAQAGSSADIFSRSMQYALFPLRLLKREFDGANRVVRATMHVFNAITSPVRLVTNTFSRMRAETAMFNAVVGKLPPRLQAPAKAFYYLGQSARVPIVAILGVAKAVTTVVGPLVRLGGPVVSKAASGLRSLASSATGFIGRAVGIRSAADSASAGIAGMGRASGAASGGLMSLIPGMGAASKLGTALKYSMAGMAAGMVMWGSTSAIATESATVSFGTMLKDMDQGKAVIAAITKFSGETPFSNSDLRDAGKLLLTAQVPADQLIDKLRMLGDVASGTGKPIEEYAAIFQKVKNTGKFGLEQINQLAERGVPIYGQLQSQLGVTRDELSDMISKGKLGFTDMETALAGLTTGTGLFAGGMAAQSQTFAGLWSTLKDNVAIVLEKIVGGFTMLLKPAMAGAIFILQKISEGFIRLEPVFTGVMTSIGTMFTSVWTGIQSLASSVFGSIFGDSATTFDSIITYVAMFAGAAGYAFENIGTIASYAWKTAKLGAAMFINDIVHFFGTVMPAYLSWFGTNFGNIFIDGAIAVLTVFENLGTNIRSIMYELWKFIKSGGTHEMKFAFTPLMDGFISTLSELPNITPRAMTELEKSLTNDLGTMGDTLGTGFADAMQSSVDKLAINTDDELKAVADQAGRVDDLANDAADDASKRAVENKAVSKNSSEGQNVVAQFLRGFQTNDPAKATAQNTATMATALTNIERETRGSKRIVSRRLG